MRSTLAGILAGLSLVSAALLQPGPWTLARVLGVIAGALVGVLGTVARDHTAVPPPLPCEAVRLAARASGAPLSQVEADAIEAVLCSRCGAAAKDGAP